MDSLLAGGGSEFSGIPRMVRGCLGEGGDAWESPGSRVRRVEGGGAGRTTALNLDDSSFWKDK